MIENLTGAMVAVVALTILILIAMIWALFDSLKKGKWLWFIFILVIPVLGMILYYFFGGD